MIDTYSVIWKQLAIARGDSKEIIRYGHERVIETNHTLERRALSVTTVNAPYRVVFYVNSEGRQHLSTAALLRCWRNHRQQFQVPKLIFEHAHTHDHSHLAFSYNARRRTNNAQIRVSAAWQWRSKLRGNLSFSARRRVSSWLLLFKKTSVSLPNLSSQLEANRNHSSCLVKQKQGEERDYGLIDVNKNTRYRRLVFSFPSFAFLSLIRCCRRSVVIGGRCWMRVRSACIHDNRMSTAWSHESIIPWHKLSCTAKKKKKNIQREGGRERERGRENECASVALIILHLRPVRIEELYINGSENRIPHTYIHTHAHTHTIFKECCQLTSHHHDDESSLLQHGRHGQSCSCSVSLITAAWQQGHGYIHLDRWQPGKSSR